MPKTTAKRGLWADAVITEPSGRSEKENPQLCETAKPTSPPPSSPNPRQKIKVKEAAALNAISEDTFRRYYSHLIKQVAPRCQSVELGAALNIGEPLLKPTE
jgi:hypothetical protein